MPVSAVAVALKRLRAAALMPSFKRPDASPQTDSQSRIGNGVWIQSLEQSVHPSVSTFLHQFAHNRPPAYCLPLREEDLLLLQDG
jgi:hypothetical protein